MVISEWYRCATHRPYPVTRRQIVEVEGGYQLSAIELLGQGPESLAGYDGGWQFPSKTYTTVGAAEQRMIDNGFTREVPVPGVPPVIRKRSGEGGTTTHRQRAVRIPDARWARFGELAEQRGTNRNAVINTLIDQYCQNVMTDL